MLTGAMGCGGGERIARIREVIWTNMMQLYVPDTTGTALIQRQSAHSAVVLPGAFPLAHFGVVALKRVAMRQVARKIDPELQFQLKRHHQYS